VNHTLIRSARLSFCAIALAAGCSVNEAGKIPCGDANNCPTDYGRCSKAGFCVVGTQPAALVKDSGDVQSAIAGDALASPLVVEVQDTNGDPVPGITIAWAVQSGAGSVSTASNTTGPDGKASLPATLGKIVGANSFTATAAGLTNSPATFTATGVPGPAASFQVSFPISVATHIPHSATVTAQDKNGNSTSFNGTVNVIAGTSDNGIGAVLPQTFPLSIAANGSSTVTGITFATARLGQSITITDTANALLKGTQAAITVTALASTTAVVAAPNPSVFGQSVTFTATVAPASGATGVPTGTVTFSADATQLGVAVGLTGGNGHINISTLSVGTPQITANYSGDTSFAASDSTLTPVTQTVNKANVTVALARTPNSTTVFGQPVTFTATVSVNAPGAGTPTGNVTFFDASANVVGCAAQTVTANVATCITSTLTAGSHPITAVYNGDASFNASPASNVVLHVVAKAATTVVLTRLPNTGTVFGQLVTFTATIAVTAPGLGAPTGNVTFNDGLGTVATCTAQAVAANVATCAVSALPVGSHAITAVYNVDANFNASPASNVITHVVAKADTTVVLTSSANPSVFGQTVTFTATISVTAPGAGTPTGNVTFRDNGVNIGGCASQTVAANVATCTLTTLAVGTHPITATYNGDASFNASSVSNIISQLVNKADVTVALSSGPNPSVFGQLVTFTATLSVTAPGVGTPTGNVTFRDNGVNIATCSSQTVTAGTATCSLSVLAVGTHPVTATYNGDGNFNASSTSNIINQVVNKADTAVVLTRAPTTTTVFGQTVTFTATISVTAPGAGTPTGAVAFQDNGVDIGTCAAQPVSGGTTATCVVALPAGTHPITAVYSGDASFNTSTSNTITEVVNKANTSVALARSPNASTVFGQTVTFTATIAVTGAGAGTPTGTVTFQDAGTDIASCAAQPVAANVATCVISTLSVAGSPHPITAIYSGDANFNGNTSNTVNHVVNKASVTVALASDAPTSTFGQTVTFTATLTVTSPGGGSPTGTVTFSDNGNPIGTCTAQTVTTGAAICALSTLSVGTHPITAVYNGDANFNASPTSNTVTQVVVKATPTVTISASQPGGMGASVQFNVIVTGSTTAPSGTVTVALQATPATTIASCSLSATGQIGSCNTSASVPPVTTTFVANYPGDGNYNSATGTSSALTVQIAPPPGTAAVINGGPSNGKVFIIAGNGVSSSVYDPATSALTAGPALTVSRSFLTATPIGGGQVLLAGGNATATSTFELCTFGAKAACSPVGGLTTQRCHAAAALVGSSVLVAGGDDCTANATALASWDLWSADAIVSSTAANQMSEPRASLTATVIAGGTVLLAGGGTSSADLFKGNSIEKTAPMSAIRSGHSATLLAAGSKACASGSCVFIAGGASKAASPSWEIFDVVTGSFGRAANATEMLNPLRAHQAAALLADGRVLLAGGTAQNQALETSEAFDGAGFKAGPSLQTARTGAASAFVPSLDLLMLSGGSEAPELITGY
jgi:hypothetical protein